MQYRKFCPLCFVLLLSCVLFGCGSGNPLGRLAVSGKVMLDGEPLECGSIEFAPRQHTGVGSGAVITNGNYSIPTQKGLPPGKYLVRIFSTEEGANRSLPAQPAEPGTYRPSVERIPPKYNTQSDQVVEVTADGSNRFDFDVVTNE